jgi:hypothetical protein
MAATQQQLTVDGEHIKTESFEGEGGPVPVAVGDFKLTDYAGLHHGRESYQWYAYEGTEPTEYLGRTHDTPSRYFMIQLLPGEDGWKVNMKDRVRVNGIPSRKDDVLTGATFEEARRFVTTFMATFDESLYDCGDLLNSYEPWQQARDTLGDRFEVHGLYHLRPADD